MGFLIAQIHDHHQKIIQNDREIRHDQGVVNILIKDIQKDTISHSLVFHHYNVPSNKYLNCISHNIDSNNNNSHNNFPLNDTNNINIVISAKNNNNNKNHNNNNNGKE